MDKICQTIRRIRDEIMYHNLPRSFLCSMNPRNQIFSATESLLCKYYTTITALSTLTIRVQLFVLTLILLWEIFCKTFFCRQRVPRGKLLMLANLYFPCNLQILIVEVLLVNTFLFKPNKGLNYFAQIFVSLEHYQDPKHRHLYNFNLNLVYTI